MRKRDRITRNFFIECFFDWCSISPSDQETMLLVYLFIANATVMIVINVRSLCFQFS